MLSTKKIDLRNLQEDFGEVELLIAADVTSPYTGAQGAARLFGKQKGGSPETLAFLDGQAVRLAKTTGNRLWHRSRSFVRKRCSWWYRRGITIVRC